MPTTLLTDVAEAKITVAAGTADQVAITHVALGDGGGATYDPTHDQTALVNERVREPIESRIQLDSNTWRVRVEFAPETTAFDVREMGFFDADGDLIAIWAGADVVARRTGVVAYLVEHVLNFSRVDDGVVIVDAPDDYLYEHAVADLETQALDAAAQLDTKLYHRDAEEALAARDEAAAQMAPVGMVAPFARLGTPAGWIECDGREVSRADYAALFAAIGITFGAGDGATTFAVPDLRGEFVRGWDHGRGADPSRVFGSVQGDAIREITGSFGEIVYQSDAPTVTGAFSHDPTWPSVIYSATTLEVQQPEGDQIIFAASSVVPTADENRPRNVALKYCIRF